MAKQTTKVGISDDPFDPTLVDIRDLVKTRDEVYSVLRTDAGTAYDARSIRALSSITDSVTVNTITGFATETTLALIKDTDGIKKITDALPTGTNSIGKISDITNSITPGVGQANLGKKTGQSISFTNDVGVASLVYWTGAHNATTFGSAGYSPMQLDGNGMLYVNIMNDDRYFGWNNGNTYIAASAPNINSILVGQGSDTGYYRLMTVYNGLDSNTKNILGVGNIAQFDDVAPSTVTENQFGLLRMSANRNLYVTIRDAAGNERGLNIDSSGNLATTVSGSLGRTWTLSSGTDSVAITGTATVNVISGFALESGGNLAAIKAKTDNIPPLGQALVAGSVPVVLTAAQIITLTPPAAITNFALETGGNLATLAGAVTSSVVQSNIAKINSITPLMGNGVTGTGSLRVTIASDNTAFSVNATLAAETTKVIGTVNQGTSPWVVGTHAITIASGGVASGAIASGAVASGAIASGAIASGAIAAGAIASGAAVSGAFADGSNVTLGAKTDAKSTATDGTSITIMQVLKEISAMEQAPASRAVTAAVGSPIFATLTPSATGGWTSMLATSSDGSTALTGTAQVIKASAGTFGGYYIYNPNAAAIYVHIYNVAAASVTVGTTNPQLTFCIPATAAANIEIANGVNFATAMSCAATTTGGGNTAPTTALEAVFYYK